MPREPFPLKGLYKWAPHSWIYNILPYYRIYNSKLISKKFPKKLEALLVDIQLRTGNFSRFWQSSRALLLDIQLRTGNFLDSRKVPKPHYKIYSLNLKFPLCQKAVTYFIYMYCKVASINACYKFKNTFLVKRSQ